MEEVARERDALRTELAALREACRPIVEAPEVGWVTGADPLVRIEIKEGDLRKLAALVEGKEE